MSQKTVMSQLRTAFTRPHLNWDSTVVYCILWQILPTFAVKMLIKAYNIHKDKFGQFFMHKIEYQERLQLPSIAEGLGL